MVMSDLKPEIEIWPFFACAMKNMQYNHYYRKSSVTMELAVEQIPCSTEHISGFTVQFIYF